MSWRARNLKRGTKVYLVCVAVVPWLAILPAMTHDPEVFWYSAPISGAPFVVAHALFPSSAKVWPGIVAYTAYFALVLVPLAVALNARDTPVGRTLVWTLVGLALATHLALTAAALYVLQVGIALRQLGVL